MQWIAPSEKDAATQTLEKRLWDAADQFRANSGLKAQEYSAPVLGLIFLRFAEVRFNARRAALSGQPSPGSESHPLPAGEGRGEGVVGRRRGSRVDDPTAYHADGILFLPPETRFDYLLHRPEAENIGAKVNAAMREIEKHNPQLAGVLPKTYNLFTSTLLKELLKKVSEIPASLDYDAFGRIYEYFLGEFAMTEGQGGGEFYTPSSIVRLLAEVIEPYHGRILDPACGSGGMFVQSARFVSEHKRAPRTTPSPPSPLPAGEGGHFRGGFTFAALTERARELRKKNTPAEALMWELLRDRQCVGLKFRRQHQLGDYLLDFYCHESALAVELDGEPHNTSSRKKKDATRDAYLKSRGVTVLRFENRVAIETPELILESIAHHASPPSPPGRRAGDEGAPPEYSGDPARELSIHGVEKTDETGRLCRLNLAVHGLEGEIKHGGNVNSYYDDPHNATGAFDFVLANPPFNVNAVDKERLKDMVGPGRRFPFGLPRTDNANYLWIQLFYSALNARGRAGFVMANSASDARSSEQDIRQKLIESGAVDVMVAVGPNMFYTVTLPCTLWFFDRGKAAIESGRSAAKSKGPTSPDRSHTVLFIDARHIYRQVDRAHRDWTPAQIGFIANMVRLYRGEQPDFALGGEEARAKLAEVFSVAAREEGGKNPRSSSFAQAAANRSPAARGSARHGDSKLLLAAEAPATYGSPTWHYRDIPGLCKAATLKEIEAQGWSLNPGRYVGVAAGEAVSDEDFKAQLETLNEELETLNAAARELESTIAKNVAEILEA